VGEWVREFVSVGEIFLPYCLRICFVGVTKTTINLSGWETIGRSSRRAPPERSSEAFPWTDPLSTVATRQDHFNLSLLFVSVNKSPLQDDEGVSGDCECYTPTPEYVSHPCRFLRREKTGWGVWTACRMGWGKYIIKTCNVSKVQ